MRRLLTAFLPCVLAFSVAAAEPAKPAAYFDNSGREDAWQGGVRMIPIHTPAGDFRVWTKRVGNNPRIKVLILHGGPGSTHEAYEAFDSFLPAGGVEYYYYDQLGSAYSDQPADMAPLLTIDRFVDEVEQVRTALGLDRDNFYLYGHSWGGILAIEYALKHQQHLKGMVVSNMMSSVPAYNRYASDVLMPKMDQVALAEIKRMEAAGKFDEPRYMELLMPHYEQHVLRRPAAEWPEPMLRSFGKLNKKVYVPMQGQRARCQRSAGRLGSHRRPSKDRRADAGDRRAARHHGSGVDADDGRQVPARRLPAPGERQPHGDVRRPAGLLRRPAAVAAQGRRRAGRETLTARACVNVR